MSNYSPVFRGFLKECSSRKTDLALFDIIEVGPGVMSNGAVVGCLVVQELTTHDRGLYQLNTGVKIGELQKAFIAKRAIQFKKRIQEGLLSKEFDQNKEIRIYDV